MKKIFVSGGSKGIGREIVRYFAHHGWEVGFSYNKSEKEARDLLNELSPVSTVHSFRADLSTEKDLREVTDRVFHVMGEPDVLVNNAGASSYGLISDVDYEEYDRIMDTNFKSTFFLTKAFLPSMIRRKSGSVICISSVWGQTGASCEVLYSASKSAVIGFVKALSKELAPSGIAVNCICPGVVDTDMMACFSQEEKKAISEEIPVGRFAKLIEIAEAVYRLADFPGNYLTGQVIGINGGMYC